MSESQSQENIKKTALSEYEVRKEKVTKLRDLGIIPYAQKFDKKYTVAELHTHAGDSLRDIEIIVAEPQLQFSTAGRVTLFRSHGKLSFAKLLDESGEIQLMFHRDMCFVKETGKDNNFVAEL